MHLDEHEENQWNELHVEKMGFESHRAGQAKKVLEDDFQWECQVAPSRFVSAMLHDLKKSIVQQDCNEKLEEPGEGLVGCLLHSGEIQDIDLEVDSSFDHVDTRDEKGCSAKRKKLV